MLAITIAAGLLLQAPQDMKPWVDQGFDPSHPGAQVVSGAPELEPAKAWQAVSRKVVAQRAEQKVLAAKEVRSWMPEVLLEPIVLSWARGAAERAEVRILDRDLLVRDHGFGASYQAFLLIQDGAEVSRPDMRQLQRRIDRAERRILVRGGCTAALWALIALAGFWLDRLTRGYMSGRLTLIAAVLGLCAPGIFLLP